MTEPTHFCQSDRDCVNRTDTGAALTMKPSTLCHACVAEIQGLYDALPDLRLGVGTMLGGLKATDYGSTKVGSSREPPTPMKVHIFDLLVEIDAWLALPKRTVRDIVNSGNYFAALHLRKTARRAQSALGLERVWLRRLLPCARCNLPALGGWDGSDSIQCSSCGAAMTRKEYEDLCLIVADR